ncbi:MAG: hypothetical protein P1V18_06400 [Candidatus Gracilibacteria bacterium]|nr:hypothetical protein [Candidatus Gracilibacteria bacterium]
MNYAQLVAEIIGPVYLTVGLGFLINGAYYKKMINEVIKDKTLMYFGGIMALVLGILILRVHSVWMQDWTVLVTLIGWIAVLKGLGLLFVPEKFLVLSQWFVSDKSLMLAKVVCFVIGGVFTYYGYFA